MNASQRRTLGILICSVLSAGALGLGVAGMQGIDLMWAPFGSVMVLSRTVLSLAILAVARQAVAWQEHLTRRAIGMRARAA